MTGARALRTEGERRAAAYHEAGHAVADYVLGWRLRRVTIRPRRYALGRTVRGGRRGEAHPKGFSGKRYRRWLAEADCVSSLCGPVAERVAAGREPFLTPDAAGKRRLTPGGDWERVGRVLTALAQESGEPLAGVAGRVTERAAVLLGTHVSAVRALAEALLVGRTIRGAEAERIITEHQPRPEANATT
jgi:hypothetical protein